jgi:hypothetical protein
VTGQWEALHTPPNCGIVVVGHDARGYATPQVFGNGATALDVGG